MCYEDFYKHFSLTNLTWYSKDKLTEQSFKIAGEPKNFFEFELKEDLDFNEHLICFTANQMGDKLKEVRKLTDQKLRMGCPFEFLLYNMDSKS